jgi:asparagine N-glycosylation enzyme membrane subunit Stt3
VTNEPEWKDASPPPENLPVKGRDVIICIVCGIALGALAIVGMRIRPVGLSIGVFAFFSGIMMMIRRRQLNYKPGLGLAISGFLMLLANPRFGVVAGFAGYFLMVGAIGLFAFGIFKAIKLAWELGKFS